MQSAPERFHHAIAVEHLLQVDLRLPPEALQPLEVPHLDAHRLLLRALDLLRICSKQPALLAFE